MNVRFRRLQSEYQRLKTVFAGHPRISIAEAIGHPPDKYIIEFRVKGLVEQDGQILERETHMVEITLGQNYPREMPRCVMLTPVFHPNIDHLAICTEDIGSAGQTLDRTVIFIGEMISYQAYNLQSPRNGDAARWTSENLERLPLESIDLVPQVLMDGAAEIEIAVAAARAVQELEREHGRKCAHCGGTSTQASYGKCGAGHDICAGCAIECTNCATSLCPVCGIRRCDLCGDPLCSDCEILCGACGSWVCLSHLNAERCTRCAPGQMTGGSADSRRIGI